MNLSETYGGRVRVRVGALILDVAGEVERLLLVKHSDWSGEPSFWTPPGGGVEFGESLTEALVREVAEETGLQVEVEELMYTLDFVRPPLHAVSFYFRCRSDSGQVTVGSDPELQREGQFIEDVQFIPLTQFDQYVIFPGGLAEQLPNDVSHPERRGTARYLGTMR